MRERLRWDGRRARHKFRSWPMGKLYTAEINAENIYIANFLTRVSRYAKQNTREPSVCP